jgi:hypothetical protein
MPLYGINEAQEQAIRARPGKEKAGKEKGSEVERWNEIYKIIFPDALDMPSPCKLILNKALDFVLPVSLMSR